MQSETLNVSPSPKKRKKDNRPQKPNNGIQKADAGGKTTPYGNPYVPLVMQRPFYVASDYLQRASSSCCLPLRCTTLTRALVRSWLLP